MTEAAAAIIGRLYEDAGPAKEARFRDAGSSSLYGELTPRGAEQLFRYLKPTPQDVFYDLGSGFGKAVLQAAICTSVGKVRGIELLPLRHAAAQRALERAQGEGLVHAECTLSCGDFMLEGMTDATVIYTCSIGFPSELMDSIADRVAELPPETRLVTVEPLEPDSRFDLVDTLKLEMTWDSDVPVYVYQGLSELARASRRAWI
jgi:SAM-dependent methyltransferase